MQLQDKQDYVTSLQDELDGSASTTANQREELHAKTHDVKILDERVKRLQEALDRERMKKVQQAGAQAGAQTSGGGGNEGAENEKLRRDLLSKTRQIERASLTGVHNILSRHFYVYTLCSRCSCLGKRVDSVESNVSSLSSVWKDCCLSSRFTVIG